MSLIIPITDVCNQDCLFCSSHGRKIETDKKHLIRSLAKADGGITISGGEPTLSKDLFWLIRQAKSKGLAVELQTNAATLHSNDLVISLARSGIDLLNVNFCSHKERTHDRLTQTQGLFKRKMEGLRQVQLTRIPIRLTHVINALTYKDLEGLVRYVRDKIPKCRYIQFSFIKIMGQTERYPRIVPTYEGIQPYLSKALKACSASNIEAVVDHIPLCYLGDFKSCHVDYQKISAGVAPTYALNEKIKLQMCRKCRWAENCYGVRKDYHSFFQRRGKDG